MEEYEVSLKRLGTAGYIDTSVWQRDNGQTIAYRAEVEGMEFSGEDEDNFTAFKKLRDDLLKGGYGMCCAGAMTNAVQSGMLAGSDRVYLVMKGRKPALTDAVWIFMETAMTEFPDSMAQDRFAEEWFGSI
ncbi:MAG: hypothetical protein IJ063_01065 [Ruminococcus sp.]|nr:hypothetical protein [Ruminococcus sp.]